MNIAHKLASVQIGWQQPVDSIDFIDSVDTCTDWYFLCPYTSSKRVDDCNIKNSVNKEIKI